MVREGTGQETVYFDRDGDLRLEVGPDEATYIVCSRALSRASPVFKARLYGSFAGAKPADPKKTWIVKLPEDDPPALATLLNIMHSAFGKVRNSPTELELYGITLLTDKYDLLPIIRPWAESWLNAARSWPANLSSSPHVMWIAWELGDEETFKKHLRRLLLRCSVDVKGRLVDEDEESTDPDPDGVLERLDLRNILLKTRRKFIRDLLSPVHQLLILLPEARKGGSLLPCVAPLHSGVGATERGRISLADERWICRTTTLGSFVDALFSADLFPLPHQQDYLGSARILYHQLVHEGSRIKSIHIPAYIEPLVQRTQLDMPTRSSPHSACNPKKKLRENINAVFNEYTDLDIDDDQKAH